MISRHLWFLRRTLRKVWVRVVGLAALALATIVAARLLGPWIPPDLAPRIGGGAVEEILGILASSMLAVTTFSLSIAVTAFNAAAGSATPRATALLQEDRTTQNVLATFLGAFLFALVGVIALQAGLFDARGRLLLFIATLAVVVLVVVALIRWIGHLMAFGRMGDTLDRVEQAATAALAQRLENPYLGGRPLLAGAKPEGRPVRAGCTGFVQHIDMGALEACATAAGGTVAVMRLPGSFVHVEETLALVTGEDVDADAIRAAFAVGRERTFEEDPRFGLVVLAEIASRALSPAVNDPGTAIAVIGRLGRILSLWRDRPEPGVDFPSVWVPPIYPKDALEDAFRPIARDSAGMVEVQIRLQKTFLALVRLAPGPFGTTLAAMSAQALARARAAGLTRDELAEVVDAATGIDQLRSNGDPGPV